MTKDRVLPPAAVIVHCIAWALECSQRWHDMELINERMRFCHTCNKAVHLVRTSEDLRRLSSEAKCVAIVEETSALSEPEADPRNSSHTLSVDTSDVATRSSRDSLSVEDIQRSLEVPC